MNMKSTRRDGPAFGKPGIEPRWTRGNKDAVGTAYSASSRLWFTLSAGILNEVYYPTIDKPQIRDLQYLIADGESFFHDERRHLDVALGITKMIGLRRHRIEHRLKNLLFLSNRDRLVHLLLDLAEQFGSHADDGIRLRIKLSHQELASLIGSTRETVTVILGQLKAEGSIDSGRRKIVLTAPQRLARSVHRPTPCEPRPKVRLSPGLVAG